MMQENDGVRGRIMDEAEDYRCGGSTPRLPARKQSEVER